MTDVVTYALGEGKAFHGVVGIFAIIAHIALLISFSDELYKLFTILSDKIFFMIQQMPSLSV